MEKQLKQQILTELNSPNFPNLSLIYDNQSLDFALEILNEELAKEKKKFKDLLKIKNEDLTFESFENDGILDYYWSLLNHLENIDSNEKIRKIIETFRPKLQDFGNEVAYGKPYFEKLQFFYKKLLSKRGKIKGKNVSKQDISTSLFSDNRSILDDQKRIMYLRVKAYKDRGIDLSKEKQNRLKEINKKLAKLSQKFGNNVVDDEKRFEYLITDFEIIKDLPKDVLEIAKKNWEVRAKNGEMKNKNDKKSIFPKLGDEGLTSKKGFSEMVDKQGEIYLFDSDPTNYQAIMKYCSSAKVREDFEKANYSTASNGKFDNRELVLKILNLRQEKARILGYKNYVELSLNSKMANSPKEVLDLLGNIYKKARKKTEIELKEFEEFMSGKLKTEGGKKNVKIHSYDLAYFGRIFKEEKYKIDEKEMKNYFEFDDVLNYLHRLVEKFYGIEIKDKRLKTKDERDLRIYEIYKNKKLISYYFLDPFFKQGKRLGAWADNLRGKTYLKTTTITSQSSPNPLSKVEMKTAPLSPHGEGQEKVPIIVNVCNFQKALNGKTTLYFRDVETIFHEFGHAIHEMLSESQYSELSGFGVEGDFVELPSQLMENWVNEKESLKKLARHFETKKSMPRNLLERFDKLKTYMMGIFWVRQLEFALLDMNIHQIKSFKNVEKLDKEILKIVNKYSLFKRKNDYKMYTSFSHIFDGGYQAGYYSYIWAEIIEADVFSKVKKMGMFNPKTGKRLLETIIGQGTRKRADELFKDFMGRKVRDKAFLEKYEL